MDPNQVLDNIRKAVKAHYTADGLDEYQVGDLIDAIEALDGWMSRGGFSPTAWRDAVANVEAWNDAANA